MMSPGRSDLQRASRCHHRPAVDLFQIHQSGRLDPPPHTEHQRPGIPTVDRRLLHHEAHHSRSRLRDRHRQSPPRGHRIRTHRPEDRNRSLLPVNPHPHHQRGGHRLPDLAEDQRRSHQAGDLHHHHLPIGRHQHHLRAHPIRGHREANHCQLRHEAHQRPRRLQERHHQCHRSAGLGRCPLPTSHRRNHPRACQHHCRPRGDHHLPHLEGDQLQLHPQGDQHR